MNIPIDFNTMVMLLLAFGAALGGSLILCVIALHLFPWFRSGERKAGAFRSDESTGNFRVDTVNRRGKKIKLRVNSNELPLLGGWVMILAVAVGSIGAGVWIGLDINGWTLLGILLLAMVGYGIVGFLDDAGKVYKGAGITEIQKFVGVIIVSLGAAVAFNRFVIFDGLSARFAYPPYSDIPGLGHLLQHTHFAWIAFFLLMTVTVATVTALAVDFSDGMDGLTGGLIFSAALSLAAILLSSESEAIWPAVVVVLAMAGAALGYLPFNWPSSWRGKGQTKAKRRARLIMGDTGSLALGGVLALVAVISRLEFLLIFIGGVFVLEGLSALISARILVRFFRMALYHERYGSKRGFPHTEFPLPFLATPMHHHYDLLGWDRKRLVYAAWLLGAGLGVLGVASAIGTFTWERYLARFVAFLVLLAVWQSGALSRNFFIGLSAPATPKGKPATKNTHETRASSSAPLLAKEPPRRLALYYGYPFKLFGRPLYALRDMTDVTDEALETPGEHLSLWTRMNVFDARALLGFYCYRAGELRDAVRIWDYIPRANLLVRPQINDLMMEARNRLAMESEVDLSGPPPELAPAPTDAQAADDVRRASFGPAVSRARLEPVPHNQVQPDPLPALAPEEMLWSAAGWLAATSEPEPNAVTEKMPALADLPVVGSSSRFATPKLAPEDGLHNGSLNGSANGKSGVNGFGGASASNGTAPGGASGEL